MIWHQKPGLDARISARLLEVLVRHAGVLRDEVYMKVTHDGVFSCVADEAHISIVETEIPRSAFVSYNPRIGWVGFDARPVSRFLVTVISARATASRFDSDPLSDHLPHARDDIVVWHMNDEFSLDASGTEFSMRMLDKVDSLIQLLTAVAEKWPLVARARVKAEPLKRAVKHCESVCRVVVIDADSDGFVMTSKEDPNFRYLLPADMEWEGERCQARGIFDLRFVSPMVREIPDSIEVNIGLGNDVPILMEWHLWHCVKTHFAVCPMI